MLSPPLWCIHSCQVLFFISWLSWNACPEFSSFPLGPICFSLNNKMGIPSPSQLFLFNFVFAFVCMDLASSSGVAEREEQRGLAWGWSGPPQMGSWMCPDFDRWLLKQCLWWWCHGGVSCGLGRQSGSSAFLWEPGPFPPSGGSSSLVHFLHNSSTTPVKRERKEEVLCFTSLQFENGEWEL